MRMKSGLVTALGLGAGCLSLEYLRRRTWLHLRRKIVLITGGSRGLGLAMAREFGSRGAIVAICARDGRELERAHTDLSMRGVESHTFVCDVTDRGQVLAMVADVTQRLGSIDVLANSAGIIKVGPFLEMDIDDFNQAMQVMFWGSLYTTLAVLPAMLARKAGRIVNITSLGGKVSVPHLLPYSCAKFAAVALSEGLRAELGPQGIRVTTIVPGLLRTGSHLKAEFKGKHSKEYAWFAAGAATPVVSIAAQRAARAIVRATIRGIGEKILSVPADGLARLHGLFPSLTGEILSLANRMLPSPRRDGSRHIRTGDDIEAQFNSRLWKTATLLGQRAAENLNEIQPAAW